MTRYLLPLSILILTILSCEKKKDKAAEFECKIVSAITDVQYEHESKLKIDCTNRDKIKTVNFYLDGNLLGTTSNSVDSFGVIVNDSKIGKRILAVEAVGIDGKVAEKQELKLNIYVQLGQKFQGGTVFYTSGEHGLIAAINDMTVNSRTMFAYGIEEKIGSRDLVDGKANTEKMKAVSIDPSFIATHLKEGFSLDGYSDWYVPSYEELRTLISLKELIDNFETDPGLADYWSSTEISAPSAMAINFSSGLRNGGPKSGLKKVRLIRAY